MPTTGPQPTVAEENAHLGTTAWRLPGPAADVGGLSYGSVTGYVAEQALDPGQTERIYVSAPGARHVRIRVYRMGWYGGTGGREVLASDSLPVVAQPPCTHRSETGLTVCDWHPTLSFVIPPALPGGVYIAKLSTSEGARDCLFVVRAAQPQPLLAQLPTATYEAYNGWGGDSLYPGGIDRVGVTGTTQGVAVSYDRPYDGVTGAGEFFSRDVAMLRFLERYDYPVSYTTSESVDGDPSQLTGHRGLIDFGHSEYWSQRQENAFARARDAGTSLLFFGSDTLGWRVRYAAAGPASSEAGRPGHVIIAYKEHASLDPDRSDPTGPFPGRGAQLADSAYLGCATPRVQQPGPSTYRYYAWSPAPGLRPSWLFAHTGIGATTRIPGIVGYELDQRTPLTPAGTRVAGGGAVPVHGRHRARAQRADAGTWRRPRRDHDLHRALGSDRVQHRHDGLGARPRAGAQRVARRTARARSPRRRDDTQPDRPRAEALRGDRLTASPSDLSAGAHSPDRGSGADRIAAMRVRVGSADLYFEVFGQQHAVAADAGSIELRPTVLALHGGPGVDGTKLRFLLAPLADIAQVVVPDQRGHGLSDYRCPAEWNLAQWAGDVKALADVLGIERPIVLGESFGGFVAQQYASSFPQHPAGVVLVSSGPRWVREDEILARPDLNQAAEVAAAVTRRGDDDPAAEAWINRVEPLLRTRSSKLLELVNALRIRTIEVNEHFEAEGVRMDLAPRLGQCALPSACGNRRA